MPRLQIALHSQEGLDGDGLLQSHQRADVPAEIALVFMRGGLKKVRRLAESYFTYRFGSGAAHVRGIWRAGEPTLKRRFHHIPGLHGRTIVGLGRLRSTGTLDTYRGYHEVRDGEALAPAARIDRRPWPGDIPWVSPSAGEFVDHERDRSYRGLFEIRVERTADGCTLHTLLVDFPVSVTGAGFMNKPWSPMRSIANLEFLRGQIEHAAHEVGVEVDFSEQHVPGVPARPRFRFERHEATNH